MNAEGCLIGFDSFMGLPEEWVDTGGKVKAGHFSTGGVAPVCPGALFVVGVFSETLPAFEKMMVGSIGFAHVDCDLYSSTKSALGFLRNKMPAGGIIVFDELLGYPAWQEHEFRALQESGLKCEYIAYCSAGHEQQVAIRVIGWG